MLADMIKQDVIEKKPKKVRNEDEDIRGIINNLRNKDQNGYYPTTLPFKLNEIEDTNIIKDLINNKGNLNENEIFLFQFPRIIPFNLEVQEKLKNEEILNEEPQYDQNGYLIQSGFSNSFNSMKSNMKLGKIKFYKSGKIKMQIGNSLFDVNGGVTSKFAQEVSLYSEETDELVFLGKINDKKVVVTPDFNY
jgi:DNA-directed RNA polymerase III subunit RPC4